MPNAERLDTPGSFVEPNDGKRECMFLMTQCAMIAKECPVNMRKSSSEIFYLAHISFDPWYNTSHIQDPPG